MLKRELTNSFFSARSKAAVSLIDNHLWCFLYQSKVVSSFNLPSLIRYLQFLLLQCSFFHSLTLSFVITALTFGRRVEELDRKLSKIEKRERIRVEKFKD